MTAARLSLEQQRRLQSADEERRRDLDLELVTAVKKQLVRDTKKRLSSRAPALCCLQR